MVNEDGMLGRAALADAGGHLRHVNAGEKPVRRRRCYVPAGWRHRLADDPGDQAEVGAGEKGVIVEVHRQGVVRGVIGAVVQGPVLMIASAASLQPRAGRGAPASRRGRGGGRGCRPDVERLVQVYRLSNVLSRFIVWTSTVVRGPPPLTFPMTLTNRPSTSAAVKDRPEIE